MKIQSLLVQKLKISRRWQQSIALSAEPFVTWHKSRAHGNVEFGWGWRDESKGGCDSNPSTDGPAEATLDDILALERVPWADPSSTVQLKFKITLWKASRTILIQFTNEEKALRAASLPKYFWHPWLSPGVGQTTCPLICYKIKLPLSFSIPLPRPVKSQEKPTAARANELNNEFTFQWTPPYNSNLK